MLRDNLVHHFGVKNTNCAETTLLNANDYYHLGLSPLDVRLVSGFGGGCCCGNLCGALAGALAVIGAREVKTIGADAPELNPRCKRMVQAFQNQFGSCLCCDIQPQFEQHPGKCQEVIRLTADLLEKELATEVPVK